MWKVREAEEKGDACYDQGSERPIVSREVVRQAPWDKHPQNPAMAQDEALRRVAAVEGTVRILLLREEAGAERARLLSPPGRFVVSVVMRVCEFTFVFSV